MREATKIIKEYFTEDMKVEYRKLGEIQKERIKLQIEDWGYLMDVLDANIRDIPQATASDLQRIVGEEHLRRIKDNNIGKATSQKARALIYDKYFYKKTSNGLYLTYVPTLSRQGVLMSIIALKRISTDRGSLYMGSTSNGNFIVLHSHIFSRYADRSGVTDELDKAVFWVMKEMFHAKTEMAKKYETAAHMVADGYACQPMYKCIASGMLLGDLHYIDDKREMAFYKTYISQDMFKADQDKNHEKAWADIMEDYKKTPKPLPLI